MPSNPTTTAGIEAVDYEYVQSCGAHGVHAHGQFDAFVGSQREIWIGSDGSGLIRGTSGPASFFTEDGRARWEAADSRELTHGPSVDLFAPGCLPGSRARRARLQRHPDGRKAALSARSPLTLHTVQELLEEALVRAKEHQSCSPSAGCRFPCRCLLPIGMWVVLCADVHEDELHLANRRRGLRSCHHHALAVRGVLIAPVCLPRARRTEARRRISRLACVCAARSSDPSLIGEHYGLDAVAQAKF